MCCQLTGSRYLEEERTLMLRLRAGGPEPVWQPVGRSRGHVVSQSQRLLLQLLRRVPGQQTLALTLQTHQNTQFHTVPERHGGAECAFGTHPRMLEVRAGARGPWGRDGGRAGRRVQRSCEQHHVVVADVTLQLIGEGQTEHVIYTRTHRHIKQIVI